MAGKSMARDGASEIDERQVDGERLDRVIEGLAARLKSVTFDYADYFNDRLEMVKWWKVDFERGEALSTTRREGLTELERMLNPALARSPYQICAIGNGRVQTVSVRVLTGGGRYFVGAVGGPEGAAYKRLSEESWPDFDGAAKALAADAWTQRTPSMRQRQSR